MQITIFGVLVVLIGIWCQFGAYRRTVVVMFGLVIFGAASALDLPALGGASVTPANFFLVFFLLRLMSMRGGLKALVSEIGPRGPLFIFLLLVLWIVASAILLPRLFDGATSVYSLARTLDADNGTTLLHPTSGNISQAVYAIGGFLVACATCAYARKPDGTRVILSAIVLVTSLHIGFGALDLVTSATHTGFILDLIHTASYAFLTDDELGGLKRISGSFSETSAFASFSLTLLAVNFVLFVNRIRPKFTGPASVMLTAFIGLATSSTGYAGLAVFFAGFLGYASVIGVFARRKRIVTIAIGATATGLMIVSLVILFLPGVADVARGVINDSLLTKGASDSALERGAWNAQSWQIFMDTHGVGGGIGSTRSSNYVLVLLSNLGVIGFVLFVLLLFRLTCSRIIPNAGDETLGLVWAARIAILASLVPALLVGTVYDLGTMFYCLAGIAASGIALPRKSDVRDLHGRAFSNASFSSGA